MEKAQYESLKAQFDKRPRLIKERGARKQALIDRAFAEEVSTHDPALQRH